MLLHLTFSLYILEVVVAVVSVFHELSVYPKKELPFFILFTAGLCSFTALLALLTYQYPEPMGLIAKTVLVTAVMSYCFNYYLTQVSLNYASHDQTHGLYWTRN